MRYVIILIVSVLVGISCALPYIFGFLELKKEYEPFTYLFPSDIVFDEIASYGPSASYFKEKLSLPFETDIYEYKDKPNLKYLLPIILDGGMGYLFKSLRLSRLFVHFLFPLVSFLLVYVLAKRLSNNHLISCFSAVIFCTLGFGPRTFLNLYERNITQPVLFSRVNSPALTLPFLLLSLIGLIGAWNNRFKIGIILSGVFGGLLFYTYYYYQLTYPLTLILLAMVCVLQKKWDKFFRVLLIAIIMNIVAIPWYLQYIYTLKLSPGFTSHYLYRYQPNSFNIMPLFILIVLVIIISILWKSSMTIDKNISSKILNSNYMPVCMLCVSSISLQFLVAPFLFPLILVRHFMQQITVGFSLLIVSCFIGNRLLLYIRIFKPLIIISICTLITVLFLKQINVWQYTKIFYRANPAELIAEKILIQYTGYEDVIGIKDPFMNSVFPTRLWRFRFYTCFVALSNIDSQENIGRYLFIQKLFDRSWEEINKDFTPIVSTKTIVTIPYLLTFNFHFFEEGKELKLSKLLYESLTKDFLRTKKLDYLLCLSAKDESSMLSQARKLDIKVVLVKKEKGVSLYKIIK